MIKVIPRASEAGMIVVLKAQNSLLVPFLSRSITRRLESAGGGGEGEGEGGVDVL